MQVWNFLVSSGVNDETPVFEFHIFGDVLRGFEYLQQQACVGWLNSGQIAQGFFRHDDDMQRITRLGMMKGQQALAGVDAFERQEKTHMGKNPTQ